MDEFVEKIEHACCPLCGEMDYDLLGRRLSGDAGESTVIELGEWFPACRPCAKRSTVAHRASGSTEEEKKKTEASSNEGQDKKEMEAYSDESQVEEKVEASPDEGQEKEETEVSSDEGQEKEKTEG